MDSNLVSGKNDPSLKAREIEALTFVYPAEAHPAAGKHVRLPLRPWRATVGVAGLVVVLGALAWFVLRA